MSDSLVLSIHIEASPETVFRFLSDPVLFQKWMGPGAALTAESVTVHYPTGESATGTVRESVPNERLVFGWGYSNNTHGLTPDSTTVAIALTATPSGTTVTLTHSGLNPLQQTEHAQGWNHYLAQLSAAAVHLAYAAVLPTAVDQYILAWNSVDPADRQGHIDACWDETAIFRDSMGSADGRTSLNAYIGNAQKFVPGFVLELAGTPEQTHGYYRFSWNIRMPDGNIMGRGTNFVQINTSGRFLSAIGFWDKA